MESKEINSIYDRLLQINMKIEIKNIPDPVYVSEKISLCHVYIEEVEKFFIIISKEKSVIQRALNNSLGAYELRRDELMANDTDIRTLPNIRDREAQANNILRDDINTIKDYQNQVNELDNILKAINLKLRNLNRLNSDIKAQLRLIESQIKLGTPSINSSAAKSMVEELSKSTIGVDVFEDMKTSAEESNIVDPTKPLDVDELLSDNASTDELLSDFTTEDSENTNQEDTESTLNKKDSTDSIEGTINNSLPLEENIKDVDNSDAINNINNPSILEEEIENKDLDKESPVVDLDQVLLEPSTETVNTGGKSEICNEQTETPNEPEQKEVQNPKNTDDIDIDSLLEQFN